MSPKKSGKVIKYPRSSIKKRPGIKTPRFINMVILGCIGVALFLYMGQLFAYRESKQELNELQDRKEALQEKKEVLQEEVGLLQEDEYIEMKARKHLGMVRQGEIIFYVVE